MLFPLLASRQASLAYYDAEEALKINPHQPQARQLMKDILESAEDYKNEAVTLALEVRATLPLEIKEFVKRIR